MVDYKVFFNKIGNGDRVISSLISNEYHLCCKWFESKLEEILMVKLIEEKFKRIFKFVTIS